MPLNPVFRYVRNIAKSLKNKSSTHYNCFDRRALQDHDKVGFPDEYRDAMENSNTLHMSIVNEADKLDEGSLFTYE